MANHAPHDERLTHAQLHELAQMRQDPATSLAGKVGSMARELLVLRAKLAASTTNPAG